MLKMGKRENFVLGTQPKPEVPNIFRSARM
jgi:hypothetical protein